MKNNKQTMNNEDGKLKDFDFSFFTFRFSLKQQGFHE
jgi:hypothetical protein